MSIAFKTALARARDASVTHLNFFLKFSQSDFLVSVFIDSAIRGEKEKELNASVCHLRKDNAFSHWKLALNAKDGTRADRVCFARIPSSGSRA